ncbi:MAG: PD-(D/E)XK nuclease family protein [Bdellovibrionales bacterium]
MLKIQSYATPSERNALFLEGDPALQTWVVSDLQSKWQVQRDWLRAKGALESVSVLRATELWRSLIKQGYEDVQILSPELAQTLIWRWLEKKNLSWIKSPQSVNIVLGQVQTWMTCLTHPDPAPILAEWLRANPEAYQRWGGWLELVSELWSDFREKRWLMAGWIPGYLLNEDLSLLQWPKQIVFDLGAQLTLAEGQLIQSLGGVLDVTVLCPTPNWSSMVEATLAPYEDLVSKKRTTGWQPQKRDGWTFARFATQLAEAKEAVAKARSWLEQGISPEKIAIVAPDIEEYWPTLRMYLREEGLPVRKDLTAKLGSYAEVAAWLSTLRLHTGRGQAADLELHLFTAESNPRVSVSEFRRIFTNVYDARDLNRQPKLFQPHPPEPEELDADSFLNWSLDLFPSGPTERLEKLMGLLLQETPSDLKLSAREWVSYLEGLAARREVNVESGDESGIWCVSLTSSHRLPATHLIMLNQNEEAMRRLDFTPVPAGDRLKLRQDTGFALGGYDQSPIEFETLSWWQAEWEELHCTFAATDMTGRVLTPSRLWMWASSLVDQIPKEPRVPSATRWDEIQKQPLSTWARLREIPERRFEDVTKAMARDAGENVNSWSTSHGLKFSIGGLERYKSCPFVFAMEKKFYQKDEPSLDLDLDRLTRGKLLHAILDRLGQEPFQPNRSDEDLMAVVEQAKEEVKVELADERFWPALRSQHIRLAKTFLAFEAEWRGENPNFFTRATELDFQGFWDVNESKISREPTDYPFSGRIDRLDQDQSERLAVIDYKASKNGLNNWASWLKTGKWQLPFYAMAVEAGLIEGIGGPVVAANYYVVKDRDRTKGFYLGDPGAELYDGEKNRRNYLNSADKEMLFSLLAQQVSQTLRAIEEGQLNPGPDDLKICDRCNWRRQCRAPHLN